jgi:hypothetical protein
MKSLLPAALAAVLLSACSSVSVKDWQHTPGATRPAHVYVVPFDTTSGAFKIAGDKTGGVAPAFRKDVADKLADYTVQNVSKHVVPASRVPSAAAAPKSGWLISGRFIRVNTGNRGLRMMVGLGSGGTKVETAVEVFDLASNRTKPFLHFTTTGGSNAMPGFITSGGPGVASTYALISGAGQGVTDDAARTSRMITGTLSEYFGERGWTPKGKVFKVKKPGEYQLVHGM